MIRQKQAAREELARRHQLLDAQEYATRSRDASRHLFTVLRERQPEKLLAYRPYQKWREVVIPDVRAVLPKVIYDRAKTDADADFPSEIYDAIIVPLYGFNDTFYRLGHGGGWYDRLLARQPEAYVIGLGLEIGLVPFEVEPHDIPMDCIITDTGVRYNAARERSSAILEPQSKQGA